MKMKISKPIKGVLSLIGAFCLHFVKKYFYKKNYNI